MVDLTQSCRSINRKREIDKRRTRYHFLHHQSVPDLRGCSICQNSAKARGRKKTYYDRVWKLTEAAYQKYKSSINPTNIHRGSLWHLDHVFSIKEGFRRGIDPKIIASHHNLQMMEKKANLSKGSRCDISIEELNRRIAGSTFSKS